MNRDLSQKLAWTEPDVEFDRLDAVAARLAEADGPADLGLEWPGQLWIPLEQAARRAGQFPRRLVEQSAPARSSFSVTPSSRAGASRPSSSCLSTTRAFADCRQLAEREVASRWLRAIAEGRAFTTVGISHLTTSRRLGAQPVKAVEVKPGNYRINGTIPWVTAAERADVLVTGAVFDDGRQMLIALPTDRAGVEIRPPFPLAALQASCTTEVLLKDTQVDDSDLLAGPGLDVLSNPGAVGTAGLETSALALGQARAALAALSAMPPDRSDLAEPLEVLSENWKTSWNQLIAQARGEPNAVTPGQIRTQANSLVLRSTQAYLTARRGAGFLWSDPAQRWARQALFFLVWSCPTPVAQAAIRDLAGLCNA